MALVIVIQPIMQRSRPLVLVFQSLALVAKNTSSSEKITSSSEKITSASEFFLRVALHTTSASEKGQFVALGKVPCCA